MTQRGPFQPLPFCDSVSCRAQHMEDPMSAQKAKGGSWKFLTLLFCLFPELPSVPCLGPYGHSTAAAPFPSCSQRFSPGLHRCFCWPWPWAGTSSGERQGKKHLPSTRAAKHWLGRGMAGMAAFLQSWLCIYLFYFSLPTLQGALGFAWIPPQPPPPISFFPSDWCSSVLPFLVHLTKHLLLSRSFLV